MDRNLEEKLQDLIRVSHKAYEKGFTGGSGGNVSIRYGEKFYISCTGTFLGSLVEEDFTCIKKGRIFSAFFIFILFTALRLPADRKSTIPAACLYIRQGMLCG